MADPLPKDPLNKYYFCDDATLTIFYCNSIDQGHGLIYVGTSNNPNPKMAVAAFTRQGKVTSGYRIQAMV